MTGPSTESRDREELARLARDIRAAEAALADAETRALGKPRPAESVERAAALVLTARAAWRAAWRRREGAPIGSITPAALVTKRRECA